MIQRAVCHCCHLPERTALNCNFSFQVIGFHNGYLQFDAGRHLLVGHAAVIRAI